MKENENVDQSLSSSKILLEHMLRILRYDQGDLQAFLDNALNEILVMSDSRFGYIYHYEEAKKQFILNTWSKDVMADCKVVNPQSCYELDKTGFWGEAVRQRKPIILNDFQKDHPLKKGYPEGHVAIKRFITVPIFDQDQIVAVLGLANREKPYGEGDVILLNLIMDTIWKVVKMSKAIEREAHIKQVLLGIRNVNQLITKVDDPNELIRESCINMTDTLGYRSAWILLLDQEQKMTDFASAGDDQDCKDIERLFAEGKSTKCVQQAIEEQKLITYTSTEASCADCPMAQSDTKKAAISQVLAYKGKKYGVLTAWVPVQFIHLKEEKELFNELAGDIAFALYKIEVERKRYKLESDLRERNKELNCLLQIREEMQKEQSIKQFFDAVVLRLKAGFQFPDKAKVNLNINFLDINITEGTKPDNFLTTGITITDEPEFYGLLEVYYDDNSAFLIPEEQHLLDNIGMMISQWLAKKMSEERLRLSEENLSMTLLSIGDGVIATDIKGNVTRMNPVAEALTGYKLDEVKGQKLTAVFKIVNADTRKKVNNPVDKVLETGKIIGLANHTVLIAKNGKEFQIADSAAPIRDINGKMHGVILVFSDVTEKYHHIKALTESESRFKAFFETVPGAVSITEVETGEYIDINPAFEKISGYSREELIGKTSLEINIWVNVDDRKRFVSELSRNKLVTNMEAPFRTKSGRIIQGLMTAAFASFDGVPRIVLIVNDISELHLARLSLNQSNTILTQLPVSVLITDTAFNIEYCNPATRLITAYSEDELEGKRIDFLIDADFFDSYSSEIKQQLSEGRVWNGEYLLHRADDSKIWISASISPVFDQKGQLTNYTIVQQDISQQKKLLEELTIAKEKAESGDRLKTAFMNNISHEIRTPLNSILGFSELLFDEQSFQLEDRDRYLKMVQQSSQRLINTITAYMDISLISSGNYQLHQRNFSLNPIFQMLRDRFAESCPNDFVQLELSIPEEDVEVYGDTECVEKVMSHLIDNAIKFTPSGKVSFGYKLVPEGIKLFVEDTGIGIDPRMQQQIFEFFVQENQANTRGHEGSGLGLAIVKGIVELSNGSIEIQSEKRKGTKIEVYLPSDIQNNTVKTNLKSQSMQHNNQKSPVILIAEDEDTNFFVLDLFIRKSLHMKTVRAANGLEAVELFKSNPDIILVLMDIKMPVLDGISATKKIKAVKPDIPVIAITAYALSGDEHKLRMAGCDDYVSKPVQKKELLRKIENILGNKQNS